MSKKKRKKPENEKAESEEQDNAEEIENEKLKDVIGAKYLKMGKVFFFWKVQSMW